MSRCPSSQQVARHEAGAGAVVHRHRHERWAGDAEVGAHRHHRDVGGHDPRRSEPLALGGDQHDRLRRLVLEVLDGGTERRCRGVGDARQADEVAGLAGRHLDGDHRARRSVQVGSRRQHADHTGAAGDERAGGGVAPVAELGDRPPHPLARRRPHVRVVVEHPRHRLVRHPRGAGDVVHAGRPRRRHVLTHDDRGPA